MFFDDELPKQKQEYFFPRNIENMSILELKEYINELEKEITRVKNDINNKQASKDAAASFFK